MVFVGLLLVGFLLLSSWRYVQTSEFSLRRFSKLPFYLFKFLKEREGEPHESHNVAEGPRRPSRSRTMSTPSTRRQLTETEPLLRRRRSFGEHDADVNSPEEQTALAGGTILGIHNLAIVFPQFIVCISLAPLVQRTHIF